MNSLAICTMHTKHWTDDTTEFYCLQQMTVNNNNNSNKNNIERIEINAVNTSTISLLYTMTSQTNLLRLTVSVSIHF